jgi:CelD/BcsL family acetyltransferase involved in cellulose biosynthesis
MIGQRADTTGRQVVVHRGAQAFEALRDEWDALAEADAPSPYTTHAWLSAYLAAFGDGDRVVCPAIHAADGALLAAACLLTDGLGGLVAATNDHSGDWGTVAADDAARRELWSALAGRHSRWLVLSHLVTSGPCLPVARAALSAEGYRIVPALGNRSPYLVLPATFDELLMTGSRNLRSQVARRGRQLEREGRLELRTETGGDRLDRDLAAFFEVEASGWKARRGTAIRDSGATEDVYRRFAHNAAARGWLRLHLLELDGRLVAGDLGCAIGGIGFLVKTGFDEDLARLSPGLVLRARVLAASIDEGLRGYDFLGPDDAYKLRWTSTVRPRVTLRAFRGPAAVPATVWWRGMRPALKRASARVRRGS